MVFVGRRTGHRAIVNVHGDLIVCPLPLEQRLLSNLHLRLLGRYVVSLNDHYLSEYMKSLLGTMEMQFRGKGAPGGAAGVFALLQASKLIFFTLVDKWIQACLYRTNASQATLARARA